MSMSLRLPCYGYRELTAWTKSGAVLSILSRFTSACRRAARRCHECNRRGTDCRILSSAIQQRAKSGDLLGPLRRSAWL
eukprot:4175177-Amphidinium_carterae.2